MGLIVWFGGLLVVGTYAAAMTFKQLKSGIAMKPYWDLSVATRESRPAYFWANVIPTAIIAFVATTALLFSIFQVLNAPNK